jgi:D-alanine-D-alanine ligase
MHEELDIDWSSETDRFILERYSRIDRNGVLLRPLAINLARNNLEHKYGLVGLKVVVVHTVPVTLRGSKFAAADEDSAVTAGLVGKALIRRGLKVEYLELNQNNIESLEKVSGDVIVNLCEWTGADTPLAMKVFDSLEKCRVPFTGANRQGWLNTVNKATMKNIFERSGVTIPGKNSFPMIVKPAMEHCSIGIGQDSIASSEEELARIVEEKKREFGDVVIEEFVDGPELQVTLMEFAGHIEVLPPAEIDYKAGRKDWPLMSFDVRWTDIAAENDPSGDVFVPELPEELVKQIETDGIKAFNACGLSGYARMDMRLKDNVAYVLEINSNPGLGDHYSYGMTLAQWSAGLSFSDVCLQIVASALYTFGKLHERN